MINKQFMLKNDGVQNQQIFKGKYGVQIKNKIFKK